MSYSANASCVPPFTSYKPVDLSRHVTHSRSAETPHACPRLPVTCILKYTFQMSVGAPGTIGHLEDSIPPGLRKFSAKPHAIA